MIKKLRKRLGWTQQQLADELGVSRRAVIYWEKGKRTPGNKMREKLDKLVTQKVNRNVNSDFVANHGGTKESVEDFQKLLEDAVDPFTFELQEIDPEIDRMELVEKCKIIIDDAVSAEKDDWWLRQWVKNIVAKRFGFTIRDIEDYYKIISQSLKERKIAQAKVEAKERICVFIGAKKTRGN